MGFFIWIFSIIIFFFLLHIVIQSAIDNSEMAQTLKSIQKHLEKKEREKDEKQETEDNTPEEIFDEVCPACDFKIKDDTKECPSCGLTLID